MRNDGNSGDSFQCMLNRRQRGEKRPIPDEQKDDKYFERRKRNNEAAKKSRDARKMREDRVSIHSILVRALLWKTRDLTLNLKNMPIGCFICCRLHFEQLFWNRKMLYCVHNY